MTQSSYPEFPRYHCHKIVGALKITKIEHQGKTGSTAQGAVLHFENPNPSEYPNYPPLPISAEDRIRIFPDLIIQGDAKYVGGYFVKYNNGYTSWSPADAFEDGYIIISRP